MRDNTIQTRLIGYLKIEHEKYFISPEFQNSIQLDKPLILAEKSYAEGQKALIRSLKATFMQYVNNPKALMHILKELIT